MVTDGEEVGRILRGQWFSFLRDIGDIALQRRTWLDVKNTNPHWSYIEFVCSFPDDDQLQDASNKGWFADREARILKEFRQTLIAYDVPNKNEWDNAAILNDPAWYAVVDAAQKATANLLAIVADPVGRAALLGQYQRLS